MTLGKVAEALPRAIRLVGWPKLVVFFFFFFFSFFFFSSFFFFLYDCTRTAVFSQAVQTKDHDLVCCCGLQRSWICPLGYLPSACWYASSGGSSPLMMSLASGSGCGLPSRWLIASSRLVCLGNFVSHVLPFIQPSTSSVMRSYKSPLSHSFISESIICALVHSFMHPQLIMLSFFLSASPPAPPPTLHLLIHSLHICIP